MRVLLDECLPRKLKHQFSGHEVATVQEKGWSGTKNGALMKLANGLFDVFVTADQNLQYQQNLAYTEIAVVVLVIPNTRIETIMPLMPQVNRVLESVVKGEVVRVAEAS
jgi:predicted nuclease of predicted toxin-antitoxin system